MSTTGQDTDYYIKYIHKQFDKLFKEKELMRRRKYLIEDEIPHPAIIADATQQQERRVE